MTREQDQFQTRARELLDELNQQTGPGNLPDWNLRAQALLTFECCRQIVSGSENTATEVRLK